MKLKCSEITRHVVLDELHLVARHMFRNEDFVSPAALQLRLQIPYWIARDILDKMIYEGFCEEQIGARPCRVIKIQAN